MPLLKGLPDKTGSVDCLMIKTATDIRVILDNHYAATKAGSNGAVNIYLDDNFFIRCEAQVLCKRVDSKKYTSMSAAIKWTDKWIKKIK